MKYYLILLIVLCSLSCKKPDEYPVVPVIDFKSIYSLQNSLGYDQKMTVLLNFTDGDGDIGYKQEGENDPIFDDPTSQYYNNYSATLYEYRDGVWEEYTTSLPYGGRLPYLTPESKNKAMKGEIACDFDVPPNSVQDTFRLDVFIYDRALHKSNVVTTSAIVLTTQ